MGLQCGLSAGLRRLFEASAAPSHPSTSGGGPSLREAIRSAQELAIKGIVSSTGCSPSLVSTECWGTLCGALNGKADGRSSPAAGWVCLARCPSLLPATLSFPPVRPVRMLSKITTSLLFDIDSSICTFEKQHNRFYHACASWAGGHASPQLMPQDAHLSGPAILRGSHSLDQHKRRPVTIRLAKPMVAVPDVACKGEGCCQRAIARRHSYSSPVTRRRRSSHQSAPPWRAQ